MFDVRSSEKEILDETDLDHDLLYQNLKELEFINTHLGGHAVSLRGLKKILQEKPDSMHILDIGCGGGDALKTIARWARRSSLQVRLTGLDLKTDCLNYAINNCCHFPEIRFRCDDFMNAFADNEQVDIVHASLFCHHFSDEQLIAFIRLCKSKGVILLINDLERNPLAYYSIKWLTILFSRSPYVKNDAPLSVLRGFKKKEWHSILMRSGISHYTLNNCWAFRHLVIAYPDEN